MSDTLGTLWFGVVLDDTEAEALGRSLLPDQSADALEADWQDLLQDEGFTWLMGGSWTFGINIESAEPNDGVVDVDPAKLEPTWLTEQKAERLAELPQRARVVVEEKEWKLRLDVERY